MFRLLFVILLAGAAFAQTTTVTGTITDAAGDRLTGTCSITPVEPFTAAAGWRVAGTPVVFAFSNGSFSAALAPTDSASPTGQYYQVECAAPQQTINGNVVGPASWGPRYWLVPTSSTPLDISQVEVTSPPPSPSWTILPQQIQGGTLTPGVNCFNVNSAGYIASLSLCSAALAGLFQPTITLGTTAQYFRGDLSLATFPTTWAWGSLTGVPTLTNTVFGRSGAVTAQEGDYTYAQIAGTPTTWAWANLTGVPSLVNSVFGRSGTVTPQAGDYNTGLVPEGTNLYFTVARAQAAMAGLYQTPIATGTTAQYFRGDLSLATFPTTWGWGNLTGVPSLVNSFIGRTGAVTAQAGDYTTTLVTESTNLYFTNARAQAALAGLYQTPITTGTTAQYFRGDLSLATFPTTWAWSALAGVPSLVNTIFGRSGTVTAQSGDYASDQVTEGSTNLYFTNARAQAAMGGLYQTPITTGTTAQYFRGDLSLATFPTTWAWGSLTGVPTLTNTVFGRSGAVTAQSGDYLGIYEPVLGSPTTNGYVLSSTTAGVRSWIAVQSPISGAPATWPSTWAWSALSGVPPSFNSGQILTVTIPALATGHLYYNGTTLAWDPATYLTGNQTITITGPCAGSGATSISLTCTIPWANVSGALSTANTWTASQAFNAGITISNSWANFITQGGNSAFFGGGGGSSTATYNTSFGQAALQQVTSGGQNTAFGAQALYSETTTGGNTAVGYGALYKNQGYDNVAVGEAAGNYYPGPNWETGVSESVFIGMSTNANGNSDVNEIVIGYGAYGAGSNTAVIGSTSTTDVYDGGASGGANHHENGQFLTSRYSAAGTPIPTCNSGNLLLEVAVTDATSGTPGTTYASGGTWTVPVRCKYNSSGSSYVWMIE